MIDLRGMHIPERFVRPSIDICNEIIPHEQQADIAQAALYAHEARDAGRQGAIALYGAAARIRERY